MNTENQIVESLEKLPSLDANSRNKLVHRVFQRVADKYDLTNDVLSFGLHRIWKRIAITILNPPRYDSDDLPPWRVLDCATGSGDILLECLKVGGNRIRGTASDVNPDMLELATKRLMCEPVALGKVDFVLADAVALPFCDNSFDAVTIGFGIRNVARFPQALKEFNRVIKPGGKLVCLEFSRTETKDGVSLQSFYVDTLVPLLGKMISGSMGSYDYLAKSIQQFPNVEEFPEYMEKAGFSGVKAKTLSGGVAAVYSGYNSSL